jgi:hypothetical protein
MSPDGGAMGRSGGCWQYLIALPRGSACGSNLRRSMPALLRPGMTVRHVRVCVACMLLPGLNPAFARVRHHRARDVGDRRR